MLTGQLSGWTAFKCAFNSFLATYFSGVMHPLDLLKTRFQSHDGKGKIDNIVPQYRGIVGGLRMVHQQQGIRGLYKGFHISMLSQASATAFFFWMYEVRKAHYLQEKHTLMNSVLLSSLEASVIGTIVTQPMWVLKTRMLLNTKSNIGEWQNMSYSTRQIYQQEGFKGFSKGLGLSLPLCLSGVVQMYAYQGFKQIYKALLPSSFLNQQHFICGSASKFVVLLASYPVTTVRTRIQQNQFVRDASTRKYQGCWDIFRRLWTEEGLQGFYKGFNANMIRGVAQKGIYFYCYEFMKIHTMSSKQRQILEQ